MSTKKPKRKTVPGWKDQPIAVGDFVWLWNTAADPWPKSTVYYVTWAGNAFGGLCDDIQVSLNDRRGTSKDHGFTTKAWYAKKLTKKEIEKAEEARLDNVAKDQHERIMARYQKTKTQG